MWYFLKAFRGGGSKNTRSDLRKVSKDSKGKNNDFDEEDEEDEEGKNTLDYLVNVFSHFGSEHCVEQLIYTSSLSEADLLGESPRNTSHQLQHPSHCRSHNNLQGHFSFEQRLFNNVPGSP